MRQPTPLGALARGFVAGAVGAFAQRQFFRLTAPLAPKSDPAAFEPPEAEQREETATATVARRWVEGFMRRGPLDERTKARLARAVHYCFGAEWGALYALVRESAPGIESVPGTIAYGTAVWIVGDNVILPAFRLAGPPTAYSARTHGYAWVAHLVYAFGVRAAYETMRGAPFLTGVALAVGSRLGRRPAMMARAGRTLRAATRAAA